MFTAASQRVSPAVVRRYAVRSLASVSGGQSGGFFGKDNILPVSVLRSSFTWRVFRIRK
jgi:hypothetical protein